MATTPPPLVVVIENDQATLKALGRVLRAGGFEAAPYSGAEEFLASPPVRVPKCIVIDVQLGALSGLELQRRLRDLGSTIPLIVMTAFDDPSVRDTARRIGCVAFLDKASDIEELLSIVRAL
jgi:FixJ family two-component response regulator